MAEIYTENDFADRVLGFFAEGTEISSELINSFDFKGTAELMVKRSVPAWKTVINGTDGDKKELLYSCVAVQTAILLIPLAKKGNIKVRQTTNAKIEYFDNSALDILADSLKARLNLLYGELNGMSCTGFPLVSITNRHHRFHGAGFDI